MAFGSEIKQGNITENWLFDVTTSNRYCLNFDGSNDYVDFGDILATYTSFTIEAWVRTTTTAGTQTIVTLGYNDSSSEAKPTNTSFSMTLISGGDLKIFWEYGELGSNEEEYDDSYAISTNVWTHVCVTRDNSDNKVRFYKNGVLTHTSNTTTDPNGGTSTNMNLRVGASQNNASNFNGDIAQLRIFNTARSDTDIANSYTTILSPSTGGLVADWRMDEGSGTQVTDSSDSDNDGTISGATWVQDFDQYNNTLRFAFQDTTDSSNFYHGVILNKPSIRESIDLATSTAKSSNISISIPDFSYQGSPISKELFGGSNHYINQTVSVWSKVGAGTKQQIGSFRLTDISSNGDTVQLSLTSHRPWDFISFPQAKHTAYNIYEPTVYGDFTPSDKTDAVYSTVYPVPSLEVSNGAIVTLMPRSYSNGDNSYIHYDTGRGFLPLYSGGSDAEATESRFGVNTLSTPVNYNAKGYIVPLLGSNIYGVTFLDNPDNAFLISDNNADTSNFASDTVATTGSLKYIQFMTSNTPFTSTVDKVKLRLGVDVSSGATNQRYDIFMYKDGSTLSSNLIYDETGTGDVLGTGATGSDFTFTLDSNATPPTEITVKFDPESSPPSEVFDALHTLKLFSVKIELDIELDSDLDELEKVERFYCGGDGLVNSWDSSAITEIHEAHLDLLIRFGGVKQKDGSAISTPTNDSQVDGYNDLNTSKDWGIRWWQLEPIELKKALEKLQYEGGFIFRFKADGSPQYIHIPDTQTVSNTFTKQDISNVTVRPSPFSELLTKMDINYEKHPAENRHLTSISSSNSTSRTNWNIQTKENIQNVNLDAYVSPEIPATPASNPNDDFYTYYDNIFGDIKMLVSCTIVNPKYYDVEVGDIVAFSDMYPETPFGYNSASWSGLKFMITSLNRTLGELKIEAREI